MTDGSTELAQLAELLRVGAQTARHIATERPDDAKDIERLALEAERMAEDLDALASGINRKVKTAGHVH